MAYVVTDACINCRYGECIQVCPQDAFHEGPNFVVINPVVCANCGLCELVCPVNAIYPIYGVPVQFDGFIKINDDYSKSWPKAKYAGPLESANEWVLKSEKLKYLQS